jgi:hypothetical protein
LQGVKGVVSLLDTGVLDTGDAFLITRPFGSLLEFEDSADLILEVVEQTAHTIGELADLGYLHRDISVGNVMRLTDAEGNTTAMLLDLATCRRMQHNAVASPSDAITGTALFAPCSVLRGKPHTLSSDLESLQLLLTFLAVRGVVHWGGLPLYCKDNLARKVQAFTEPDFQTLIVQRCRADLVASVKSLRDLFYKPHYNEAVTMEMFKMALRRAEGSS